MNDLENEIPDGHFPVERSMAVATVNLNVLGGNLQRSLKYLNDPNAIYHITKDSVFQMFFFQSTA